MHTHTRQYYLSDIPLSEALQKFHDAQGEAGALSLAEAETLALDQAHGRVTAAPVWAARSSPHYDAAAMDGVAVRARETIGALETSPLRLTVGAQAVWVDTGDPMPAGFDAVIMIEVIHQVDACTIEIQAPVAPYQHVRPLGEDIVATELVLPGSHRLRPQDLAACAAAGLTAVAVRQPPHVAVIPTGSNRSSSTSWVCRRPHAPKSLRTSVGRCCRPQAKTNTCVSGWVAWVRRWWRRPCSVALESSCHWYAPMAW